jgi:hypothetical protein
LDCTLGDEEKVIAEYAGTLTAPTNIKAQNKEQYFLFLFIFFSLF